MIALSRHEWAVQKMLMYWGVEPHLAAITRGTVDDTVAKAIEVAKERGFVEKDDVCVVTVGDPKTSTTHGDKSTSTNVVYVAQVR